MIADRQPLLVRVMEKLVEVSAGRQVRVENFKARVCETCGAKILGQGKTNRCVKHWRESK